MLSTSHATSFIKIALIETQSLFADALSHVLSGDSDVKVVARARSLDDVSKDRDDVDVVLLDIDDYSNDAERAFVSAAKCFPNAKLSALSSFANAEVMQRCLAAGADGYVLKDSSLIELNLAIRSIASGKPYVDPRVAGTILCRRAMDPKSAVDELSRRETEIVRLVAQGLSNREIGDRLLLSEKTIKNQLSRIFDKLHISARTQAAVYAIRTGIA